MNQQCTSSTLRTLQLATIWRSAIALLEGKPGGDSALVSNLLQTTAAEYLARCFAASDHSATLICQLCEMRRHVIGRLKHGVLVACQCQRAFEGVVGDLGGGGGAGRPNNAQFRTLNGFLPGKLNNGAEAVCQNLG